MSDDRHDQITQVFLEAQQLDPERRKSFLDRACAKDPQIREAVESLLAADQDPPDFLRSSADPATATAALDEVKHLRPQDQLDKYVLIEPIGEGGMGIVWRARDTMLERSVALKFLPDDFARDSRKVAELQQEARMLASLNHPNIAAIYELERVEDRWFLVLELVPGTTLHERIRQAPLTLENSLRTCSAIARGLEAAHRAGVVHLDLKPGNVQITPAGKVKLLDFGLAKMLAGPENDPPVAHGGGVEVKLLKGTPPYMSPEQADAQWVDKRTDVWAFGCLLYEVLTGRRAYARPSISETLAAVRQADPDWSLLPQRVPDTILTLLKRCLTKDPERRLHDIADARIEIDDALADLERPATALHPDQRRSLNDGIESKLGSSNPAMGPQTAPGQIALLALMRSEIVDSVGLQTRLGGTVYQQLVGTHDRILSEVVASVPNARILHEADGEYALCFLTSSDAVEAALKFQQRISQQEWGADPLRVRIGLHSGEVSTQRTEWGGGKLVGLAVDLTARIMELARPGQILMTDKCFDDARQYLRPSATGESRASLRWLDHGPYMIRDRDKPVRIFEVGDEATAPLAAPLGTEQIARASAPQDEAAFGWRPAKGQEIPGRSGWMLEDLLGQGGFGEVWLSTHRTTQERRVFKFCFDMNRLRSFKREVTLFRLLRVSLGERSDIAKIFEIQFENPPFYLESEFTEQGDLTDWARRSGDLATVPLKIRLDLVARTADAVAAAHSVGILHKDLKPANVLVYAAQDGTPRPRLSDFGIGVLTQPDLLQQHGITAAGMTEANLGDNRSSRTGTRMYSPPESMVKDSGPFTTRGDIYGLGVLLYQMVVGDLDQPLGEGWERDVDDEVLRKDIARCVDRDPNQRLSSASELAERLRKLDVRRRALIQKKRRRLATRIAAVAAVLVVAGAVFWNIHASRRQAQETTRQVEKLLMGIFSADDPNRGPTRSFPDVLAKGAETVRSELAGRPVVEARMLGMIGGVYENLDMLDEAEELLQESLELRRRTRGVSDQDMITILHALGTLQAKRKRDDLARPLLEEACRRAEAAFSEDDPHLATAFKAYADLLTRAEELEEAQRVHERVLGIRQRAFGEESAEVAASLRSIARIMQKLGDEADAVPLIEKTCVITDRTNGPDHKKAGQCRYELGRAYDLVQRHDQAAEAFEQAIAIWSARLGEGHPNVRIVVSKLAKSYRLSGKRDAADAAYRRAIDLEKTRLGNDHPDVADRLKEYADFLQEIGSRSRADTLLSEAAAIRQAAATGARAATE